MSEQQACVHGVSFEHLCRDCEATTLKFAGTPAAPANTMQVGGDHYAGEYQHWDFVREVLGNNYLLGNATKYISRWRKKNGVEDLHKALHYIAKARETRVPPAIKYSGEHSFNVGAIFRFCGSAGCGMLEAEAIWAVATSDWKNAEDVVNKLIGERHVIDVTE